MAAKKSSVRKTTATRKRVARKTTGGTTATKKKAAGRKTATKRQPGAKPIARTKKVVSKARPVRPKPTAAARRTAALGRPRVAGTAELDLMFQKDLEAREVFAFLRVKTLKELEDLTPDEILERLTAPMLRTVGRIRKALAMNNRCLAGDQKFAVAFKKLLS
jgi:hypothetical protein